MAFRNHLTKDCCTYSFYRFINYINTAYDYGTTLILEFSKLFIRCHVKITEKLQQIFIKYFHKASMVRYMVSSKELKSSNV
jgi:hypothetical protein